MQIPIIFKSRGQLPFGLENYLELWNETRSNPKNVIPIYLDPKNLDTILRHWMSVKLADNFQIHEHSLPCLFHIIAILLIRIFSALKI
jgi:hypothetical protein